MYYIANTRYKSYESEVGQDLFGFAKDIAKVISDKYESTIQFVELISLDEEGEQTPVIDFSRKLLEGYVEDIAEGILVGGRPNSPSLSGQHIYATL